MKISTKFISVLVLLCMCVSSIGMSIAMTGSDNETPSGTSQPVTTTDQLPILPRNLQNMQTEPLKAPITLDSAQIAKLKEQMGDGKVHSVAPEDTPADVLSYFESTKATSHHEPDNQGLYYNNNITKAEFIDISGGSVTYDGTGSSGDQPRLWLNWSADKENSNYDHYWADYDIFYIPLKETSSNIDFVNITLTVDYGTSHSGTQSNIEFGAEMALLTGYSSINNVNRNQIKTRPCWWSGLGTNYANSFLDCWTGAYGSMYNSMHFQPAYTGKYYIMVAPYNMTDPATADTTVEEIWYNLTITYTSKSTSGAFSHGKSTTSDIKDSTGLMTLSADGCTGKGYQDCRGNTPNRDSNLRMVNASAWPTTLPDTKHFVNEMLDYNDWYNCTSKLINDPANKEDINASIDIYDSFVVAINGGTSMGTILIFSFVMIEVWQHDPVANMFWYGQDSGAGYIIFQDQNGNPLDWTKPYVHMQTNNTSDLLYVRTWTDTVFWFENDPNGGMYWGDVMMDVFDSWGYYNLTRCNVTKYIPPTAPSLAGGAVTPGLGDSSQAYTYNVTYYDVNNDPPAVINVNINSVLHNMVKNTTNPNALLHDGIYTNGEEYIYVHPANSFPLDTDHVHSFSFYAKDPGNLAAVGDINTHSGPHIMNNNVPSPTVNYADQILMDEDQYNVGVKTYYYNMSAKFTDVDVADRYNLVYKVRGAIADPWGTTVDCAVFTLTVNSNNTISINTKANKNTPGTTGISVYFNATDPKGASVTPPTPVPIKVTPKNDAPIMEKIQKDGSTTDIAITDHTASITATEDVWCNFTVFANDIDGIDTLTIVVENQDSSAAVTGTDIVTTGVDIYNFTGKFAYLPTNNDVGYLSANISVSDGSVKDWVIVNITVVNVNDAPELTAISLPAVDQYAYLNKTISAKDVDLSVPGSTEVLIFSCNISDTIAGLEKGTDWDLVSASATTANFWFHPVNQDILGKNVDKKTFDVQFKVTDKDSKSAVQNVKITVRNVNDAPSDITDFTVLIEDGDPATAAIENLTVQVRAPDVEDKDGDAITYEWDFGDFRAHVNGQVVNYTYNTAGNYTIILIYGDGSAENKQISKDVQIIALLPGDDDTGDDDTDDDVTDDDTTDDDVTDDDATDDDVNNPSFLASWWWLILILVILVIIIVVVVVVVMMRGKKEEEPAPVAPAAAPQYAPAAPEPGPEPMPEPSGLEPMPEPQPLPESEAPLELPPGPEGIEEQPSPMAGEPAPSGEPAPAPEGAPGGAPEGAANACPNCGNPVKPGWFLCPECKNPLS